MKCGSLPLLATVTCLFGGSAVAASVDFEESIQRNFQMGLLVPRQATATNLQTFFSGALGGAQASAITKSTDPTRPFEVDGATFPDFQSAATRSCDLQHNTCADTANKSKGQLTVGDCDQQSTACKSAIASATETSFSSPTLAQPQTTFPSSALISLRSAKDVFPNVVPTNSSSASTADDSEPSPALPPLPAPRLPDRARGLLRTPPLGANEEDRSDRNEAAHWGSPYPPHLRRQSLSSEPSEDSPIHQLELRTPFLRPAPSLQDSQPEPRPASISAAAAVLANRARRPAHGITEDWIRQHTAGDSDLERRHWLSDGAGDSENSSLSGSFSGDEAAAAAWLGHHDLQTPRASRQQDKPKGTRRTSRRYPRTQSSNETLKQAHVSQTQEEDSGSAKMASSNEGMTPDSAGDNPVPGDSAVQEPFSASNEMPSTARKDGNAGMDSLAEAPKGEHNVPATPTKAPAKRPAAVTPRLRKKVPWKGKNILVHLPRDDERGQPGKAPMPLNEAEVSGMLRSWEQLGYSVDGFDLYSPSETADPTEFSQSRGPWPDFEEMRNEQAEHNFRVLLPDLNAWKTYVDELNEAKLRALGVSSGDDEPPVPSISPNSALSRQPSVTHYPPLPFSPPLPTSSASSSHALPGFPFPAQFTTSATQSPGIPAGVSPASFVAKFNPRASISIGSPHGWSPQMMLQQQQQQQGHRVGSPSLANLAAIMSPTSPFGTDGMSMQAAAHQRHQSLQYPMLPHQFQQPPVRASPRLQDLREVDEEAPSKSPSKTPEPAFVRHNASDSLQKEIDEAEYHLEEQIRSQIENDQDYSPHNENDKMEPVTAPLPSSVAMAREPSVQFPPQLPRFVANSEVPVLYHPRPHSRGHSLSQKPYTEEDASNEMAFRPMLQGINTQMAADESEIETNPSNLGTPVQGYDFNRLLHQRSYSTASNPWTDNESGKSGNGSGPRHPSHGSKSSFSKLNVEAPEFKFNPTNTFQPGSYVFSSNNFQAVPPIQPAQPAVFNAGFSSANSSQFSLPMTNSSKINVNAPVFSPGQSDFSFSTSGPKFRPDAPAFTPHSLPDSIASPVSGAMSGAESSASNKANSIFGNIDLSNPVIVKPAKESKAVPIVRPDSRESRRPDSVSEDADGRPTNEGRVKRARGGSSGSDDAVPLFAPPTEEAAPVPESQPEKPVEEDVLGVEDKSFDESNLGQADMTMSSTMASETTDTKATVSPSEASPDNWAPFEFKSKIDMQTFNDARPFGEEPFKRGHKNSLSAAAKAFVPGATVWGAPAAEPVDTVADESVDEQVGELADQASASDDAAADYVARDEPVESVENSVDVDEAEEEAASERIDTPVEEQAGEESPLEPEPAPVSPAPLPPPPAPKGLAASRYAAPSPSPPPRRTGLSASRFAASPSPVGDEEEAAEVLPAPPAAEDMSAVSDDETVEAADVNEPSFADIDAVMRHLNENPNMGVNKTFNHQQPQWHQPSPTRPISLAAVARTSPLHLAPQRRFRSDSPSPSPRQYRPLAIEVSEPIMSTELDDPFVDPPRSAESFEDPPFEGEVRRLNSSESLPASDWEDAFSEDEQTKLEARVNFFDGHVNELVGGLLAARLGPLEQTLDAIQHALVGGGPRRTPSSRRERRSMSAEVQESDADDEDDDMPVPRRSMSPRRDRRMEQIRAAVLDAFAVQQHNQPREASPSAAAASADNATILTALEQMREQFSQSLHLDFRGEDLRNIVEDAVERRMPPTPKPDEAAEKKVNELEARLLELEQRLQAEEAKVEAEIAARRAAEDRAADVGRELESAATKIEVEMMNKSALNQRIADLEERVRHSEAEAEEEVKGRRAAEDRLSEVQRLLHISSEEETRLREVVDEREQKIKSAEAMHSKTAMRLTLLEAGQSNAHQSQSEAQNRMNVLEVDLRDARKEVLHWRTETDRLNDMARRHEHGLTQALDENRALHKLIDTLGTQLQENERIRDTWRSKFMTLQDELAQAAREIAEENARRAKKEQAMLARQEVLDARLQAEARTRERIEKELERLETGERQGMRAVAESKRLEALLSELRTENHKLQQSALRYQAEFQEARESGAREVQRTRESLQAEVEEANHQVNVVREELEDQILRLRAQLDQVRMDADTSKARHEMLLEEAQNSNKVELQELARRHQNEMEDLQARYERQLNNTTEDAQRAEQNLLERLSISASKSEHLQDKVAHLEEKLEIAKEAARAAAQAAKSASVASPEPAAAAAAAAAATAAAITSAQQPKPRANSRHADLPEKISPQALRESIMVLQEQLQEREQRLEELEQALAKVDPEAETKISKRDDEIIWLRELLGVRHSDLQDIIVALGRDDYDRSAVRDAAIRLKANLQMEEQERERAMNGASAINLPNIAATIRDAATPRVAQAVGPLAAAWGNWRKGRDPGAFGSLSSVLSSPAPARGGANATPSKNSPAQTNFLGGLLTPPASGMRQTPPAASSSSSAPQQPTAFSATGRRFTAQDLANRPRGPSSASTKQGGKLPVREAPLSQRGLSGPMTPPMMRRSAYDSDAQTGDFDDAGFFED
ncbi:hypothetical protein QBC46DRAFT_422265, partial [Diplogelasinospora grovesii]